MDDPAFPQPAAPFFPPRASFEVPMVSPWARVDVDGGGPAAREMPATDRPSTATTEAALPAAPALQAQPVAPLASPARPAPEVSHADEAVSPMIAARVVEQATGMPAGPHGVRLITPPSYSHDLLLDDSQLLSEEPGDLDDLSTFQLAREAVRARMIDIIEQRHHRTAYELVFLMLAFAVMVLLVTPPLVQLLLAARGVQT